MGKKLFAINAVYIERSKKCNAAQCSTSPPSQMLMLMLMLRFSMLYTNNHAMLVRHADKCQIQNKQTAETKYPCPVSSTGQSKFPLLGALDSRDSDSFSTVELDTTLSESASNLLGSSLVRVGLASDTVLAVQVGNEAIGELAGDESDGVVGCNFSLNRQLRETVELDSDSVGAGFDCGFGLGDRNGLCNCNGLWGCHWCGERKSWEESEESDCESGELHFDGLDVGLVVGLE